MHVMFPFHRLSPSHDKLLLTMVLKGCKNRLLKDKYFIGAAASHMVFECEGIRRNFLTFLLLN